MDLLQTKGPGHGNYIKNSKSVHIMHPGNLKVGKEFGARYRFKVYTGAPYIGVIIGDDESKID